MLTLPYAAASLRRLIAPLRRDAVAPDAADISSAAAAADAADMSIASAAAYAPLRHAAPPMISMLFFFCATPCRYISRRCDTPITPPSVTLR